MGNLELVPERSYTTTLREYAGGNDSDDAVRYFLQRKIGHKLLFIQSPHLLLFESETGAVADSVNVYGAVCVGFEDIQDVVALSSRTPDRRLAIIDQHQTTAAIFQTALHSSTLDKKQWLRSKEGTSIGELYPRVGILLDQPIEFLDTTEAFPVKKPTLKLVE